MAGDGTVPVCVSNLISGISFLTKAKFSPSAMSMSADSIKTPSMALLSSLNPVSCKNKQLVEELVPDAIGLFSIPASSQAYLTKEPMLQEFSS